MRAALRAGRAVAAAGAVALALAPHVAAAHASVISSQPQPNASYATAPGAVVLVFSEPLNTALSRASVSTPAGRRGQATVVQDRQMQVPVPDTAPGVYRVEWTTVSALDGHVLRGSFEFGVRVKLAGAGVAGGLALAATDWLLGALRWIEYLGLMVAIGALLVNRLAQRPPALPWAARSAALPIAVALGAGTAVVIVEAANSVQALTLTAATAYLTAGTAGAARLARLAAEATALAAALRRPGLAPVPVAVAAVALAASSHAAALPAWPGPIALDAAHLLAAGAWAGGILNMATLRPPGGWLSQTGRALLDRFSPVALAGFLVTLLTGALQAALEVGQPARLLSTAYGNTLLVKALLVGAILPLSVLAWRRVRARPRAEAGLVVLVVGASSLLASYPVTPARLGDEGHTQQQAGSPLGVPSDGSLSLASHAGETLVAVTVRPGRPGPNSIYLDLLPISGPAAGGRLRPSLSIDGRQVGITSCGPNCRVSSADLRGGEHLEVRLPHEAEVARLDLPALPAGDATALVARLRQRMSALRSYRIDEVLGPAAVPLRTTYWFQAPDRLRYDISNGSQTVIVGSTRYWRNSPTEAWKHEPTVPIKVPSYPWDSAPATGAYVLGADPTRGADVTVVAFFEEATELPVWFRVWVDSSGVVLRAEMTTLGHFMEDDFLEADAPFSIQEPPSG